LIQNPCEILSDITRKQRTRLSQHEREQQLATEVANTRRLFEAQQQECARIARELREDIIQRLAVLSLRLEGLALLAQVSSTQAEAAIEKARDDISGLSRDVQGLAHRLYPARAEYLGVEAAVAALCRETASKYDVEIELQVECIPQGLPGRIGVCLYRVLQESLQNAIAHSGARKVEVSLRGGDDRIDLTIRDMGTGFDVGEARETGLGLTSMKERLNAVHGQLDITSEPNHGTTIHASVPLRH
jgi:signal transduction histidine kinase